jgi:phosphatidate cytidylyltransferase
VTASSDVPVPGRPPRDPAAAPAAAGTAAVPAVGDPARRPSRAGRNLFAAVVVGAGLGAVILVPLLTVRYTFVGVLAVTTAIATWELRDALRRGAGIEVPLPVLLAGGQAMIWLSWPFGLRGLGLSFAVTALGCLVWRMRAGAAHYLRDVSAGVFTAVYVPLFCSFVVMLTVAPDGVGRVLTYVLCVAASDIGGYAVGVLAGRHPMAPTISPKKSWEGVCGSLAAGMAVGALSVSLLLGGAWWEGALTGALLVVSATLGDLVESLVKRDLGIKDMGRLLPGHGGLMDRLDSMLPTAVVAYLVLGLLVPVP